MDVTLAVPLVMVILLGMLALGVPVAYGLGISGTLGITLLKSWRIAEAYLGTAPFTFVANWTWTVVPLFILMGNLAYQTGVIGQTYNAVLKWTAKLPGSLALATTLGCGLFAGVTGSSVAEAATFAKVAVPPMLDQGYDKKLATGVVASAATFGILIPPSIVLVIYGMLAQESIGKLLIAGIVPGILMVVAYCIAIIVRTKLNPSLAPTMDVQVTWPERLRVTLDVLPLLALFAVVIGGIYTGIFTFTESAAYGALCALLMLIVKFRSEAFSRIRLALSDAVQTTAAIFALVVGATLFSLFIVIARLPYQVTEFLTSLALPSVAIFSLIMLMYLLMGMFMDGISILIITVPIVGPVMQSLGYDLIWFGILIVMVIEIGLITPPVGLNCFIVKSGSPPGVTLEDVFRGALWFVLVDLVVIALIFAFPSIVSFLPNMMMK